ncbi:MAG: hypothetical protein QGH70_01740 [Nitrospinota bacterium]|jgi:hypothetical protein|nr:hypothetical protein [Nitrospinota bacterium]MDP6482551.1 hypothetical protein [Nitrospinota bacterium]HJM41861.1 hypothetical protein [Nitrospinota bacterium]
MDWSLFKSILEAVVILVVLPGAAVHLFRTQRSRLEAQRRLLEEKDAALRAAAGELAAMKDRFRAFSDEVTARNKRAWARLLDEESATVQAAQQKCGGVLQDRFEGFTGKLDAVQRELDGFRNSLLETFEGFYDQRKRNLEGKGILPFDASEWTTDMEAEYREGTTGEVIPFPGNRPRCPGGGAAKH